MAIIQDASGKEIPSWARYVENIAALGAHTGHVDVSGGNFHPFALYLAAASTVVFTTIDDPATEVTYALGAGYHPIAFATIVSTSTAALTLFASKPLSV